MNEKTLRHNRAPCHPPPTGRKNFPPRRAPAKALYEILFQGASDGILLVEAGTGKLLEANDSFCARFGWSRQEVKGLTLADLSTPDLPYAASKAQESIEKATKEGPQLFEWLFQDRSGRRQWAEVSLRATRIGRKTYLIAVIRPIQAQKDAAAAVKQPESAFLALLAALQDVAMLLTPEGVVLAANDTAARRLGLSVPELIGLNVFDLMPPHLSQGRKAKAAEVIATGRIRRFEDEDGGFYIYNILYPIFDASGQVVQVGVYAIDITGDKKTRTELERTQARLECLLDHSPAALYSRRYGDMGALIYLSKNISNLTGFSPAEFLADPSLWAARLHPEDYPGVVEKLENGTEVRFQSVAYRFLHKDGTYRWLHDEFNLVRDRQGAPLEYIGSVMDITAARSAQEKLLLSERRYRAIVESQTDLISRFTPDDTLTYVNAALCRYLGKTPAELIGRSFLSFLTPEAKNQIQAHLATLTPDRPVGELEHQVILPDGSSRRVAWINYAFFNHQGRVQEYQGVGRDVTARREAEEALRQSELRFRTYTESSLVGIFVIQDNRFAYLNPVFAQIFGYSPEDLTDGMNLLDLVHPDSRDLVRQKLEERYAGKPSERYVVKVWHRDGRVLYCEVLGRLVSYLNRPAILGSLIDVTQQREAEEALRESEQRYRLLVETMNDGLGISDADKNITYVNTRMCELIGYTSEELVGRPLNDFLTQAGQQTLAEQFTRRRNGVHTPYELVWTRKDGSELHTIISPRPMFDRHGNFTGSFAVITDISARREAEAASQRREQYFRLLTENVSDVIGLLNSEGLIRYLNPTVADLLGYTPAELMGKSVFELVHPREGELLRKLFHHLAEQTGEVFTTTAQVQHRDGSWRVWEIKGKNLLHDPVVSGIVINAQDITERTRLEAALKLSARRLRALAAHIFAAQETERRRLSLELHDELGQSLTALKLQLRAIVNKLRKDQSRLKQECNAMLAYINEVVEDVRRLAHDLSPSLLDNVGLAAALRHLLDGFRQFYQIRENLQELDDIDAFLPPQSQIHLYRIFQEIFTNIEKHAQATEVTIEVSRRLNRLTFAVTDNGTGFDEQAALEKSYENPGLGLSAINERVRMLGGSLELFGRPELGARIVFTVPLHN